MKTKLFLFVALLGFLTAYSQVKTSDSLIAALQNTKSDIDKAKLLNAIAVEYQSTDPKVMMKYAAKALSVSKKIKFKIEEANAYLNLGNANIIIGDYAVALKNFSEAQTIFENEAITDVKNSQSIKKGLAKAYGSIGIVFSEQSNYARALQYHLKAVKIYEEINDDERSARIYNNIGIVYQAQQDDFKALDYFLKAYKIQQKNNDRTIGITLTNIGNSYLKQKNFPKALEYYTTAKQNLDKHPNPRALGELYNNLGLYYQANNKPELAIQNWNSAIPVFGSIADKFGVADTYLYLGQLFFQQNNYDEALASATNALNLAKELNVLEQIAASQKLLSTIYARQNNTEKALLHFQLFSQAKDSLYSHESIRKSVQAEMNFEFEKREVLQKKELEKRELLFKEASKRHNMQTFFVVLFVLLLVGIGFLIYNRMQLKKTLTLQKELAEYEQKALHLQMNPHFVFNCLGSISSFIVQNGTDSAIKYLSKFSKLMRLTLEYSKEALIPIDKEIESLQNYLELEQLRFNNKFDFKITKSDAIEDDMALPPLLLQPFVENAIIHGLIPKKENGQITIDFSIQNQSLICTIMDNGVGFNKSQELKENLVSVHKSMALDITKKRLEMMEAITSKASHVEINELKDENNDSNGTKVVLNLPIQYSKI